MSKWISVADKFPSAGVIVLFVADGEVQVGCWEPHSQSWIAYDTDGTSMTWDALSTGSVKCWRPMPKPPKDKRSEPNPREHRCEAMASNLKFQHENTAGWVLYQGPIDGCYQRWAINPRFCPYCGVSL